MLKLCVYVLLHIKLLTKSHYLADHPGTHHVSLRLGLLLVKFLYKQLVWDFNVSVNNYYSHNICTVPILLSICGFQFCIQKLSIQPNQGTVVSLIYKCTFHEIKLKGFYSHYYSKTLFCMVKYFSSFGGSFLLKYVTGWMSMSFEGWLSIAPTSIYVWCISLQNKWLCKIWICSAGEVHKYVHRSLAPEKQIYNLMCRYFCWPVLLH